MNAPTGFTVGVAIPPTPPVDDLFAALRWARDAGIDAVTTWDHVVEFREPGPGPDPAAFEYQAILGALARTAGDVRLGVGVTELVRRHPIVVAQSFLTLSHLLDRPPILGVGPGERMNTERYGLPFHRPVDRLEEALGVLRACLAGEPLRAEGDHFRLDAPPLPLRARQGAAPEIWIGARGERMLRIAGRFGDGWYPADLVDPDDYGRALAVVRTAAEEVGRDPDALTPAAELVVFGGRSTSEIARALASPDAKLHGLLLGADAWSAAGLDHPLGRAFRGPVDYVAGRAPSEALAAVPAELVERHALVGSPGSIVERLAELREAGLRHVNLSFGSFGDPSVVALADAVVAALRERIVS